MSDFNTVTIDKMTVIERHGMKLKAYIAGVNSGVYGLPFIIEVSVWAKKWWFKKFFYYKMELSRYQTKVLRDECNKVLEYFEEMEKNHE